MKSRTKRARDDTSPLDRPLPITIWADARAKTKTDTERSLRELARLIPKRSAATKSGLRLLKLASFGRKRSKYGSLRNNANVLTINGVECDYDDEHMPVFEVVKRLRKAGVAALVYTSPSHRPGNPRWRVLCPTSRSLPPAERERLVARINGIVGGKLAIESFTLSQSFYYGRADRAEVRGESFDGFPIKTMLVEGRYIDLADDLDACALDKHGKPYDREPVEPENDDDRDDDMAREPDLDWINARLAIIPNERRMEEWLPVGQALHHEFGGSEEGFELWDEWSRTSANHEDDDQRRVWDSFGNYVGRPITIAKLEFIAKKYRRSASTGELTFQSPAECAVAPPRGYIWKGMLAPGDIASIFGAPGAGKSLIAPHVGYMTALGEMAFALRTKPGRVFYVAAEDATGLRQRVAALRLRHGDAPDFSVVGGVSDLFDEHSADLEALLEAVEEQRPKLIVIDTLAMAFPGLEENDAKSMGRVVAVARQLAEHGAAVVLVHHDTKADGSTPRGHSVLHGALDMALHVKRGEDSVVRGVLRKNRNGSPDRDIAFRIGTENLGTDEDGDPITAALVEELTASLGLERVRLTGAENAALAKLIELEADGSVSEDDWRAACIDERKVSGAEDAESRKRAMRRAVQGLASKGVIETRNGMVACDTKLLRERKNDTRTHPDRGRTVRPCPPRISATFARTDTDTPL